MPKSHASHKHSKTKMLVSTPQQARPTPSPRRRTRTPAVTAATDATDATQNTAQQLDNAGPSTSTPVPAVIDPESTSSTMSSGPSYTVSDLAYTKIILHALKHPHQPVNGVLLGSPSSSGVVEIVDTIPLLHHWTSLSPMMEIGLDLVSIFSASFFCFSALCSFSVNAFDAPYDVETLRTECFICEGRLEAMLKIVP